MLLGTPPRKEKADTWLSRKAPMAVGAVSAISGSSRQINRKASGPVSNRVKPEPGWHSHIIAVSNLSAHVAHFTSADYTTDFEGHRIRKL